MKSIKKLSTLKGMAVVMTVSLLLLGAAALLAAGEKPQEKLQKGYLGVSIETLSQDDKEEFGVKFGVLITDVTKGEAAEKAGIKKYDVIQYFDGEKVRRPGDLVNAVRDTKPETKVTVKLVRDGKQKELTVIVGELKSLFSYFGDFDKKDGKNYFLYSGHGGGYLGVHLQELNRDLGAYFGVKEGEGVLILKVEEDSPAGKAGLKPGDVIVELDGKKVSDAGKVSKVVSAYEEGDEIEIKILRHKKGQTIKVELGERSGFRHFTIPKSGDFLKGLKGYHYSVPGIHVLPEGEGGHRIILRHKESKDDAKENIEVKKKAKKSRTKVIDI